MARRRNVGATANAGEDERASKCRATPSSLNQGLTRMEGGSEPRQLRDFGESCSAIVEQPRPLVIREALDTVVEPAVSDYSGGVPLLWNRVGQKIPLARTSRATRNEAVP